jgi:hypothetical protein
MKILTQIAISKSSISTSQKLSESQTKNLRLAGYGFLIAALFIALVTRLIGVFQYITFDIGPDPDQIRDAFAVIKIWQGEFPTLGPKVTTIGGHHILPLYYYLFFPFTLLGADPRFQALPNAFFSFLSVPLLSYLVYLYLENSPTALRLCLSGLAGFWYSLLFSEIFISNFQWNPSSIPFFLMAFIVLHKINHDVLNRPATNVKSLSQRQILNWALYGGVLAILISLHSSSLFIMPIVFGLGAIGFMYKVFKRNQKHLMLLPLVASFSAFVMLTPYWIGESQRHFSNTKTILKTLLSGGAGESEVSLALSDKLYNLVFNYIKLFQQVYIWDASWFGLGLSIVFLGVVTCWGVFKVRGNQAIFFTWFSTFLIFIYAASSLIANTTVFYYKLLIIFVPILLTMATLSWLLFKPQWQYRFMSVALLVVVGLSCVQNLRLDGHWLMSKYGSQRLISTSDVVQLMQSLPEGSTLCEPKLGRKREEINQYRYIDTYVTRRQLQTKPICDAGDYVIHPKRIMLTQSNVLNNADYTAYEFAQYQPSKAVELWPKYQVRDNGAIARPVTLIKETSAALLYRLD